MANPQYIYGLSGSPLVGTTVTLPRPPKWGRLLGVTETNIVHETNRGVVWPYRLFQREVRQYVFRFPSSELAAFRALHDNVQGQLTSFYWIFEGETLLVRKEAGFQPKSLEAPGADGSVLAHWYDYTLVLTAESAGLAILA